MGKRARQAVDIVVERRLGQPVAGVGGGDNLGRRERRAAARAKIAGETGAGQKSFNTAVPAAIAEHAGCFLGARPGKGVVPPFTGNGVGPDQQLTMDHQAAADAGAEDYAEHIVGALAGAVDRLGEGETISVIGQAHRPPQALAEIVG